MRARVVLFPLVLLVGIAGAGACRPYRPPIPPDNEPVASAKPTTKTNTSTAATAIAPATSAPR